MWWNFSKPEHILSGVFLRRENDIMYESDDPNADLEDLIFDEEDGGPSEK
jgi:hypothetical protein